MKVKIHGNLVRTLLIFLYFTRFIWKADGGTEIMNNKSKRSVHAVETSRYRSETDAILLFLKIGSLLSRRSDYKTAVPTTDKAHIYRNLKRTRPSLPRQQFQLWNVFRAEKSVENPEKPTSRCLARLCHQAEHQACCSVSDDLDRWWRTTFVLSKTPR